MNKHFILLFIFISPLSLISESKEVLFRVFPQDFELYLEDEKLEPQGFREEGKVYHLPEGPLRLRIRSQGYLSRWALVLQQDTQWEGKLERETRNLRLFRTVETGYQPKSLLFSPDGKYLFAPLLGADGTDVFSFPQLEWQTRLSPPEKAHWAGFVEPAFHDQNNEIWISQMTTNSVHRFKVPSWEYLGALATGGNWTKVIAIDQEGRRAWASNWVSEDITQWDLETKETKRLKVGGTPRGLWLSPDQKSLFVTRYDNGELIEVELPAFKIKTTYQWPSGALRHLVGTEEYLLASDMARGDLTWFDWKEGKVLGRKWIAPILNTIALVPGKNWVALSSRGPNHKEGYMRKGPEYGKVFLVDMEQKEIIDWVWGGNQPTGLDISPCGQYLAFSDFLDHRIQVYEILETQ